MFQIVSYVDHVIKTYNISKFEAYARFKYKKETRSVIDMKNVSNAIIVSDLFLKTFSVLALERY